MEDGAEVAGGAEAWLGKSVTIKKGYRTVSVSAKGGYNSYEGRRRVCTTSARECRKLDRFVVRLGQEEDDGARGEGMGCAWSFAARFKVASYATFVVDCRPFPSATCISAIGVMT
jgi:hypothetical protein